MDSLCVVLGANGEFVGRACVDVLDHVGVDLVELAVDVLDGTGDVDECAIAKGVDRPDNVDDCKARDWALKTEDL